MDKEFDRNIWNGTFDNIMNNLLFLFFFYLVEGRHFVEQLNWYLVILFGILFYILGAI